MARRMTAIEERLKGQAVSVELLRAVMAMCDEFIQSRSRQEYRKQVTPGFLVRALAKAMKKAGADENACAIAEEVANG